MLRSIMVWTAVAIIVVGCSAPQQQPPHASEWNRWDDEHLDLNGQDSVYPRAQVIALLDFGIPGEINNTTWTYRNDISLTELHFCHSGKHINSIERNDNNHSETSGRTHCFPCNNDRKLITNRRIAEDAYKALQKN